jgi:glycosyltransferase involved in cell wall biosynthesis
MKVLHLISSLGFFGAENVVLEIAKYAGYRCIVGVFENSSNPHLELAEEAKKLNLSVATFTCNSKLDPKTILHLRNYLKHERIQILHTHNYKSNIYGLSASLGLKLPVVTTCHTWFGKTLKMKVYFWLDKFLLDRYDKVIAVSEPIREEVLSKGVSPEKVVTISNGIDLNKFSGDHRVDRLRKEFGIDKHDRVIGTVGRLTEQKGHVYLLKALKSVVRNYPKTKCLIVGDGPLKPHLMQRSESSNIIFTGLRDDMPQIYSLLDIFVLPSIEEGLPMVLLEAMASKNPVVATNVGDIPKVLTEETGCLIAAGKEKQLADAILFLLANDEKAKQMGVNGRGRIEKFFSSQKMAEKYGDVYSTLLKRKKERTCGGAGIGS